MNVYILRHWELCMRGHSACNMLPVVASNRIGSETFENSQITFYGMLIYVYVYMYACVCMFMYVYVCLCMHVYVFAYAYVVN